MAVQSPCVDDCCLDRNDVCIGCYRTIGEILAWTKSSEKEQLAIIERCERRRQGEKPPKPVR